MPQKNQIDSSAVSTSRLSFIIQLLPQHQVQNKEDSDDHNGPEDRLLPKRLRAIVRNGRYAVDEPAKLLGRDRFSHQADNDGNADANQPAPQAAIEVFGHGLRIRAEGDVAQGTRIAMRPDEHAD